MAIATTAPTPDFNYRAALNPIEGGPYYILAASRRCTTIMGGLHINTDAQVLDSDGALHPRPVRGRRAGRP